MADKEQLGILKMGLNEWNSWRGKNPNIIIDLEGADLSSMILTKFQLSGANLGSTNLEEAVLCDADLSRANLEHATLENANLFEAYLEVTHLCRANLCKANLSGTMLIDADLTGAELVESELSEAFLSGVNLEGANLSYANMSGARLFGANLNKANLENADLSYTSLIDVNLRGSNISGCKIHGISAWNLETDDDTIQRNLIITRWNEQTITIDNTELAQFIYLLLNNKRIRHVIDTITSKVVLILGRFLQVSRNIERFPDDFMFQLNKEEFKILKSHFATSSWGGTRKMPRVFTEHGILMLSSVLRSDRAIQVNILIMRAFVHLRKMIPNEEVLRRLSEIQLQLNIHAKAIIEISNKLALPLPDPLPGKIGFQAGDN
jgi:uncharacterized protein YjbI with pentapeptide repeats